jgi:hypothetical protein
MEHSQEYLKREFVHYLSDTLALMGAGEDFVDKIRQVEEKPLTPQIIEEIRSFNCKWIDDVKTRLVLLNTAPVTNKG